MTTIQDTIRDTKPTRNKRTERLSPDGKWRSFPKVPNLLQYCSTALYFARTKINGKLIRRSLASEVDAKYFNNILGTLKAILDRGGISHDSDNPIATIKRMGIELVTPIPKLTHHDLRQLFATRCIEAGVDIPTVSRWLGHSDGGAPAMRVYGHIREQHSAAPKASAAGWQPEPRNCCR
jgi:hypothetical protein